MVMRSYAHFGASPNSHPFLKMVRSPAKRTSMKCLVQSNIIVFLRSENENLIKWTQSWMCVVDLWRCVRLYVSGLYRLSHTSRIPLRLLQNIKMFWRPFRDRNVQTPCHTATDCSIAHECECRPAWPGRGHIQKVLLIAIFPFGLPKLCEPDNQPATKKWNRTICFNNAQTQTLIIPYFFFCLIYGHDERQRRAVADIEWFVWLIAVKRRFHSTLLQKTRTE